MLQTYVKQMTAAIGEKDRATRDAALNAMTFVHMHVNDNDKFAKLVSHVRAAFCI